MPPTKPQPSPQKKPIKKITVLQLKKSTQKSLVTEYFYPILGILFGVLAVFLKGLRYRWDESVVIALWVVGILFVARQVIRYLHGEAAEPVKEKEKKKVVLAEPVKKYKPPEVPRVSKDFSPVPPPGDKRYPPPSPFIKPPK